MVLTEVHFLPKNYYHRWIIARSRASMEIRVDYNQFACGPVEKIGYLQATRHDIPFVTPFIADLVCRWTTAIKKAQELLSSYPPPIPGCP